MFRFKTDPPDPKWFFRKINEWGLLDDFNQGNDTTAADDLKKQLIPPQLRPENVKPTPLVSTELKVPKPTKTATKRTPKFQQKVQIEDSFSAFSHIVDLAAQQNAHVVLTSFNTDKNLTNYSSLLTSKSNTKPFDFNFLYMSLTDGRGKSLDLVDSLGVWEEFAASVKSASDRGVKILTFDVKNVLSVASKKSRETLNKICAHGFSIIDPCIAVWLLDPNVVETAAEKNNFQSCLIKLGLNPGEDSRLEEVLFCLAEMWETISRKLDTLSLTSVFRSQEMPTALALVQMEAIGMPFDCSMNDSLANELRLQVRHLEKQAHKLAGRSFLLTSPQQVASVLFYELGLHPPRTTKKLKTEHQSTNDEVLAALAIEHPVVGCIQKHRHVSKLLGIVESLSTVKTGRGETRIVTTWKQRATVTGRLSSANPNLQNFHLDENSTRNCRLPFNCRSGRILLAADYKQIELRVLANFCGGRLLHVVNSKEDAYQKLASLWKGIPLDKVSDDERTKAKVACLACVYGSGAQLMGKQLGIESQEGSAVKKAFKEKFPEIDRWMENVISDAIIKGYVETMSGRKRNIVGLNSNLINEKMQARRHAINTIVQGSASDLIKVGMLLLQKRIDKNYGGMDFETRPCLVLSVHDEIIIECEETAEAEIGRLMETMMTKEANKYMGIDVELQVKLSSGKSWGNLKSLDVSKVSVGNQVAPNIVTDQNQPKISENEPRYHENEPRYHENEPRYHENEPRYHENEPRYHENEPRYQQRMEGNRQQKLSVIVKTEKESPDICEDLDFDDALDFLND